MDAIDDRLDGRIPPDRPDGTHTPVGLAWSDNGPQMTSHDTWRNLRRELNQLAAIESAGPDGTIIETIRPHPTQQTQTIYNACNVAHPPRFIGIEPA